MSRGEVGPCLGVDMGEEGELEPCAGTRTPALGLLILRQLDGQFADAERNFKLAGYG